MKMKKQNSTNIFNFHEMEMNIVVMGCDGLDSVNGKWDSIDEE